MRKLLKSIATASAAVLLALTSTLVYYNVSLPDSFYLEKGTQLVVNSDLHIKAQNSGEAYVDQSLSKSQQNTAVLKLFGLIPVKTVDVNVIERPMLIPGGSPFGIKMLTDGVVVIGTSDVQGSDGGSCCPAEEAGIKIGDVILSMDGNKVAGNSDVQSIIESSGGKPIKVTVRRKNQEYVFSIKPIVSALDGCYKGGLWVRDSSAGIGTVTFFDPQTNAFGGLGHPICDVDTGEILPLAEGDVMGVEISGVSKGKTGLPGELIGSFSSITPIGSLLSNSDTGVFGKLGSYETANKAIPMALRQEVQAGPATILTTLDGDQPKEYDILIEKVDIKSKQETKNMVIKVTDPELLEKAGGIVQGMSGSPIIQNGRLVGAVTHVFVNDPTKGYGIFCENMYNHIDSVEKKD